MNGLHANRYYKTGSRLIGQKFQNNLLQKKISGTGRIFFLIIIIQLLFASGHGQIIYPFEKPVLIHYPVNNIQNLKYRKLVLLIEGRKTGLTKVSVFIKKDKDIYFKEYPMTFKDGVWEFHLKRSFLDTQKLFYFFTACFSDQRILALPDQSPEKNPFSLQIRDNP